MYQITYNKRKNKLLEDKSIHPKNKEIIKKAPFFMQYGAIREANGIAQVPIISTLNIFTEGRKLLPPYINNIGLASKTIAITATPHA